jgi:hypothetical protein
MTSIANRKTRLRAEFGDSVREAGKYRPVLMEFEPHCIHVRLKGLRHSFVISPAAIYNRAVQTEVVRLLAERKAAKKRRGRK